MPAYLVRLAANKELVGLFVSDDEDDLAEYVDECTDPYVCEFVELPPGSIHLPDAGAPLVPTIISDATNEHEFPDWFGNCVISELWHDQFYSERTEWQQLVPPDSFPL